MEGVEVRVTNGHEGSNYDDVKKSNCYLAQNLYPQKLFHQKKKKVLFLLLNVLQFMYGRAAFNIINFFYFETKRHYNVCIC